MSEVRVSVVSPRLILSGARTVEDREVKFDENRGDESVGGCRPD